MKTTRCRNRSLLIRYIATLFLSGGIIGIAVPATHAANYYWDIDDAILGAGGTNPSGNWSSGGLTWSTSPAGSAATAPYTTLLTDDLFFSAGADATGTYSITLSDVQNAGSLTFEDGSATLSGTGGAVILGGTGKITVGPGLNAVIGANTSTGLSGSAGLTKIGTGTLTLNGSLANTQTGGLNVNAGTLLLDYSNLPSATDLVNAANNLSLSGNSALTITGHANTNTSQTFASATLGSGMNSLNIVKGTDAISATLNLGALTINPGGATTIFPGTTWTTNATPTAEVVKITSFNGNALPSSGKVNVNASMFYRQSAAAGTARWVSVDSTGTLQGLPAAITILSATTNDPSLAHQINNSNITLTATNASSYGFVANSQSTNRVLTLAAGGTYTINGILGTSTFVTTINPGTGSSNIVIGSERNFIVNLDNSGNVAIATPIANNDSTNGTGGNASSVTIASTAPAGTTPGITIFNGANTYSGTTYVSRGILRVNNPAALGTADAGTIVGAGGTLQTQATLTITGESLELNGSGTTGSNGALNVGGNQVFTWDGPVVLAGNTRIHADGGSAFNFTDNAPINLNSYTLEFSAGNGANSTFAGTITGTGGLNKLTGSSVTLNLNGSNVYTGPTSITTGTLSLGNINAVAGTSSISIGNGATLASSVTDVVITAPITIGTNSSTIALNVPGAGAPRITLGSITGSGDLTLQNMNNTSNPQATFILSSASTYAGNTLFTSTATNSSVFAEIGVSNALPTTTVLTLDGGNGTGSGRFTQIDLKGHDQTLAGLTNVTRSLRTQRIVNSETTLSTLTIDNATDFTYSGQLGNTITNGNIALIKSGSGTFALSGTNSFVGPTKIFGGILSIGLDTALQNTPLDTSSSIQGDAANGLRTTVNTFTLGGLTGNKNLADIFTSASGGYVSVTALTLKPVAGSTTSYEGSIADGAAGMNLAKTGAGTQILNGANTYTGATTISAGKLTIGGAGSINSTSGVTVNGGELNYNSSTTLTAPITLTVGILSGSGTVGGTTTVASTGIVAPGNSAGNLTFANGVDLSAGGVYSWELGALSVANPGTNFDVITVSGGSLTLGGTSALTLDFGLISATDPNSADAFWTSSKSWKIIDVTGGTNAGDLTFSTITNASYTSGSFTTTVGTGGDLGDIFLVFTPGMVGPAQWTGTGDWSNAANWSGGVPNSATATASFLGMGTGTVTVDSAQTVNQVVFNAASPSYTIGGSSTLSLAGTTPTITNTTGSNTISAPLNLAAGTAINVNGGSLNLNASANSVLSAGVTATVATGATLNLGGTANALSNGTTTHANVTNNGTLAATAAGKRVGNITGTGTTDVTAASATLTASSIRQSVLSIGATSTATVAPSLGNKSAGISVFTNTTGPSLSIAAGGNFDTNDNDLIVYYQPGQGAATLATIQQQIIDGFLNTPAVAKISSSTGAVDGDKFLVAIDNGAIGLTDWEGVSLTGSNQIIAKYTLFGDLNLDGAVDSFDYSVIDSNFGTGNSWLSGDSNLDGIVNSFDYSTVDTNFGKSFPSMGGGANLSIAAVPEPSTFVLGGLGLLGLAGLKLRRKKA